VEAKELGDRVSLALFTKPTSAGRIAVLWADTHCAVELAPTAGTFECFDIMSNPVEVGERRIRVNVSPVFVELGPKAGTTHFHAVAGR
jgi:hypothetical protein